MNYNKWIIIIIVILIMLILPLSYCIQRKTEVKTIVNLAYKSKKEDSNDYTVYLKEKDKYIPYLVISKNYNRNVLFLRKHLIDERMQFNPAGRYTGYYENSIVDKFLNNDFIKRFSPELKQAIVESKILIIDKSALAEAGTKTLAINRKIFLLAYSEVVKYDPIIEANEGNFIKYFNNLSFLNASNANGELSGQWLRSSYTCHDDAVYAIGYDGTIGMGWAHDVSGIRPAFCLKKDTKVKRQDGIIDNKIVYVLDLKDQ